MPDFEEEWLVKDLRMLGIRAEPPEVELALDPAALPRVTVDALVVNPAAPAGRLYDWELWACTPDGPLCDEASTRTLLRRDRTPLGQIRHELAPSDTLQRKLLELFSRWQGQVPYYPLRLELRVFQDPEPVVRGVKSLHLVPTPSSELDSNPALERIEVNGAPLADPVPVPCGGAPVPVEVDVWAAESPAAPTLDAFTTQGRFSISNTGPARFSVRWSPCTTGETSGESFLWLVLRDGHGGIDWQTVRAVNGSR